MPPGMSGNEEPNRGRRWEVHVLFDSGPPPSGRSPCTLITRARGARWRCEWLVAAHDSIFGARPVARGLLMVLGLLVMAAAAAKLAKPARWCTLIPRHTHSSKFYYTVEWCRTSVLGGMAMAFRAVTQP